MGKLSCQRCGATAEGETFEEADERIDHALGLSKGRPCSGKQSDLIWEGSSEKRKVTVDVEDITESESPKMKKSTKRR